MRVAAEARQNAELRLVWDTAGTDSARCAWCERWLWPLRSPPSSARALRATAVLGPIPSTIPSRSMSPDTVPAQSRRTAATSPTWFATLTRAGSTCSGPGGRTCRAECKPRKAPASISHGRSQRRASRYPHNAALCPGPHGPWGDNWKRRCTAIPPPISAGYPRQFICTPRSRSDDRGPVRAPRRASSFSASKLEPSGLDHGRRGTR